MSERRSATQTQVRKVLAHFQRQRPLRSGSLIVTVFGDSLAPRGATVSLGSLIRLMQPFGLEERLVRTSVARLAADGWLETERHGRQSDYRLTEHGRARFADATLRIYGQSPDVWDGRWTLVILPQGKRGARERAREELTWLGFGQLAPGVLAHPARDAAQVRRELQELKLLDEVILIEGTANGGTDNHHLALAAWDLAELSRGYKRFMALFEPLQKVLAKDATLEPETAFIVRTLLIHEYRKVHLRDPLLPRSLLPEDWVGASAYELCRNLYTRVFAAAETFLSTEAATCNGSLPPASTPTLQRFGGLLA